MAKRIEIDGKFYRMRRGKLVQIPDEWVGKTVHPQRKRNKNEPSSREIGHRRRRSRINQRTKSWG